MASGDTPGPPTDDDARRAVSMLRALFGAGRLTADQEADLREAVWQQLDAWYLRGRAAESLAGGRT